jgi:hypothetical protein
VVTDLANRALQVYRRVGHEKDLKEMEKELSAAYSLDLRGEMLSKLVRKIYEETGQAAFWGDLL